MPRLLDYIIVTAFVLCVVWLWHQCKKAGHLTTVTWVFIATTSFFWMEAPWDWVLYVRWNPEMFLFMPVDLPAVNVAGGLPWAMLFIYGIWFTLPPYLVAVWGVRRNWSLPNIFVGSMIFGGVFECIGEYFVFIKNNLHAYSRVIPNLALAEGTPHQYALDVPFLIGPFMAFFSILLARSLRGPVGTESVNRGSLFVKLFALRSFGGTDDRFIPNLIWSVVISHVIFFVPMIPALMIRYAHWRTVVGEATPFGHLPWPW